jgi:hypothetical protein
MVFKSKEELAAYFWENQNLTFLRVDSCPGLKGLPKLPSTLTSL